MGDKKFTLPKQTIGAILKDYALMTLGIIIYCFAWVAIITPANGVGGGATGASLLIYYATGGADGGISMGISFLIMNIILVAIAMFTLGAKFGLKTIYSIILVSLVLGAMEQWIPENLMGLGNDKLLSSVLGGAVAGVGISMVLVRGGSTGGSDIIAMIINKYRNVSYGKVIRMTDFVIIACSYFVFQDLPTIIYGYILTAAFSFTADAMMAGNKQSAQIFITSPKYAEIADLITTHLNRGVTILDGTGWYSKKPTKIVMVVCRKAESSNILQHVKTVDPDAFITMGSVMGVYGKGFDTFRK